MQRVQRYCYVYPLRGIQDPDSWLHCCFLAAPPSSLYPFSSPISNPLLKAAMPRSPTGFCLISVSHIMCQASYHIRALCQHPPWKFPCFLGLVGFNSLDYQHLLVMSSTQPSSHVLCRTPKLPAPPWGVVYSLAPVCLASLLSNPSIFHREARKQVM